MSVTQKAIIQFLILPRFKKAVLVIAII